MVIEGDEGGRERGKVNHSNSVSTLNLMLTEREQRNEEIELIWKQTSRAGIELIH